MTGEKSQLQTSHLFYKHEHSMTLREGGCRTVDLQTDLIFPRRTLWQYKVDKL